MIMLGIWFQGYKLDKKTDFFVYIAAQYEKQ